MIGENKYQESSNIFFDIKDAKLPNWIGHSVMKLLGLKEAVSCENYIHNNDDADTPPHSKEASTSGG